ncbi:S9 family peptidase [Sandaracinomonas limnophila]|uniref:S9 family peptidase n=1 Tax=Sandaracinomonas limnophila TaxID=1862386 RepID=A0A437PTZ9_9BACT|nr:S9 family peptidase [Sandaracinomonas limnophila]RVU25741.1 S9 family peptidase [Sandaracinomonas limnophila]
MNTKHQQSLTSYLLPLTFYFLLLTSSAFAQKSVSLEDIWKTYTFRQSSIQNFNWTKDGKHYAALKEGKIIKYDAIDPMKFEVLFDQEKTKTAAGKTIRMEQFTFSADEKKILIETESEPIYRRSSKEENYVFDATNGSLKKLSTKGKQMHASFSPDGNSVAFVRENNIYVVDLKSGTEKAITTSGKLNKIINGTCDWVYEEEFSFAKAFFWSPDSKKIAFYTFDETKVPEYNMQMWGDLYPKDYRYKYPKAGEANSTVSISVFHLPTSKTVKVDVGAETNQYIARMQWTKDANILSLMRLNRLQNHLDLLHANANTGKNSVIYQEDSKTSLEIESIGDDLTYLNDNKSFIFTSEKSGFKHLYLGDIASGNLKAITTGNWEVANLYGVDEKNQVIYFSSAEISPIQREVYQINFDGSGKQMISQKGGTNSANFSSDFSLYTLSHNSATEPLSIQLKERSGALVRVLEENNKLKQQFKEYGFNFREFIKVPLENGVELNGYWIKPRNFDPAKKYAVLMHVYGGPGSQQVLDTWGGQDFIWYQHLMDKGYLIFCVDNRGTGARGVDFKRITYKNLGKYEVQDQISAAKWIGKLPYVDASRIGIWGWSYGGYMSSNCLMQGADVFKAAIAVAPVTNWRFYDSIYTERYQGLPQDNAAGYDDNSPVSHVNKLKGNLLLVHGTGDDNVHFQNAVALQDALIKANKQFESFYYPNRNHGISGGVTRLHLYQMMTDFLLRKL